MDLARWLCGVEYPKSVFSTGGRFNSKGAAETPDTLIATFDFDHLVMTFEETLYTPYMIKTDMDVRERRHFPLLAAEHRADRDLRGARRDVRGPARRRLAGVRPAKESPSR